LHFEAYPLCLNGFFKQDFYLQAQMKKKLHRFLVFVIVVCFSIYWMIVFIMVLPSTRVKSCIQNHTTLFRSVFVNEWTLFTPPFTHDKRLYYIIRDIPRTRAIDTIEVLEKISINKQKNTPFNQKELILDYLVNKNVVRLNNALWTGRQNPIHANSGILTSEEIATAIEFAKNEKSYQLSSTSLFNYGKNILKEVGIDTAGKEMRIVVKIKIMRPFKERCNQNYKREEIIFYETPFKAIN
jgi:hypothetical protein